VAKVFFITRLHFFIDVRDRRGLGRLSPHQFCNGSAHRCIGVRQQLAAVIERPSCCTWAAANKDNPELIAVMAPSRTFCLLWQVPLIYLQENNDGRNT
jgi:hypothetical protein